MELFEQIRREYEHGAGMIRAVAKKLGVHRRMVRQALSGVQRPGSEEAGAEIPHLESVKRFIEQYGFGFDQPRA